MLLTLRPGDRAVFLFGFAKSDRANVEPSELAVVREVAAAWLAADTEKMATAIAEGLLIEVDHDREDDEDDSNGETVPADE